MKELFFNYFLFFLHPFRSHNDLVELREGRGQVALDQNLAKAQSAKMLEFLAISWPLVCLKGIYALAGIALVPQVLQWLAQKTTLGTFMLRRSEIMPGKMTIFMIVLEVILFPVAAFFFVKFWAVLVRFFVRLYEIPISNEDKAIEEVSSAPLAANIFLIVPVFGPLAKQLASLVYIFAGLRSNLGMNVLQSLIVILTPIILLCFGFLIIGLYGVILVNSLSN